MSRVKRALCLQFLGALVAVLVGLWVVRTFPVMAYVNRGQDLVSGLGWWGVLLYPALFALCNILLLPAGTLALGSGLFFGLGWGFVVNFLGNVLGAAVAIGLSRLLGRGWIRRALLARRPKWAALDIALGREGWKIVFLSQLLPFTPSSLLNYLFGVTRVPWRKALLWSALGQAPTMFIYAWLGTFAKFGLGVLQGGVRPDAVESIAWVGGLTLTIFASLGLTRVATRLLREAERTAYHPPAITPPVPALMVPRPVRSEPAVLEQAF